MSTVSSGVLNLKTLPSSPSPAEGGAAISNNFVSLANAVSYPAGGTSGTWDSSRSYAVNDLVLCTNGTYYICIVANSAENPVGSSASTYWQQFALSGSGAQTSISNPTSSCFLTIKGASDRYQYSTIVLAGNPTATQWLISHRAPDLDFAEQFQILYYDGTNYYRHLNLTSGGNLLLGTTTDDGVHKLQVSGSIAATSLNLSSVLQLAPSSTPTPPAEGMIYLDGSHSLHIYLNGTWRTFTVS